MDGLRGARLRENARSVPALARSTCGTPKKMHDANPVFGHGEAQREKLVKREACK